MSRTLPKRVAKLGAAVLTVGAIGASSATSAQAYSGHAGCPNANPYQLVACAWHTHWRWFEIWTQRNIHVWAGPYDKQCGPGWCVIDKGSWTDGRASYYNGDPYPANNINAYYLESP